MLKNLRIKHPFIYAICIFLIFGVTMQVASIFFLISFTLALGESGASAASPLATIGGELIAAAVLIFVLWRSGKIGLLSKRGKGFWRSLAVGGYCFVFIAVMTVMGLVESVESADGSGGAVNFAAASVVYIISMMCVGFTEEIEARALIGETFLEHFGTAREGVIKACVVSGLIFGIMHTSNALDAPFADTFSQVILCITGGILYGAIYFRTGNIWAIMFIHGLNDVGASAAIWLLNGGMEVASTTTGFSVEMLALTAAIGACDLAAAFFLLRKSKAGEVAKYWPEIPEQGIRPDQTNDQSKGQPKNQPGQTNDQLKGQPGQTNELDQAKGQPGQTNEPDQAKGQPGQTELPA